MRILFYTILIGCVAVLNTVSVKAQQGRLYTQYAFNLLTINPAYAGTQNFPTITTMLRQSWVGLDSAPRTITLSGHTPFKRTKSSVGAFIYVDAIGPFSTTGIFAIYSYKLPITKTIVASLGFQVGGDITMIDLASLRISPDNNGQIDSAFAVNRSSGFLTNVGVGLYLSSKTSYFSISIPKMISNNIITGTDNLEYRTVPHIYATMGTKFRLNGSLELKPSIMTRIVTSNGILNMDASAYLLYKKKYWLGLAYRVLESVSIIVNFPILHNLRVGYAYDYSLNISPTVTSGSHELFLNYNFRQKQIGYVNPRSF